MRHDATAQRGAATEQDMRFADQRRAQGWLVAHLSAGAIGVVTWAYLATLVLVGGAERVVPSLVFAALALALLGTMLWGRRTSGGAHGEHVGGAGEGYRGRLERERRRTEAAARAVGWSPAAVVWSNRLLITVGVALMVATVAGWLAQRG